MTPEDRDHIDAQFAAQNVVLQEMRETGIRTEMRLTSLESTRAGVISAMVMTGVSVIGSAVLWLLSFVHWGAPKS